MTEVRELADAVHARVLARSPFFATAVGLPGHDADVPDLSERAAQDDRAALLDLRAQAERRQADAVPGADAVTLAAVLNTADAELTDLEVRTVDHVVTVLGGHGPSALLALVGQTRLQTAQQAQDHLTRTAAFGDYLRAHAARLRGGAEAGRLPVAALVRVALGQVDGYLAGTGPDPFAAVTAPAGWDGAAAWSDRLAQVVEGEVRPAVAAWRDAVAALPTRTDEACGMVHLPGGAADYERLVRLHTTLPTTAAQVHELGRTSVEELVARMVELGSELGLTGHDEIREAVRASGLAVTPAEAMSAARTAVRRAEAAVPAVFPEPLPPYCEVTAMSEHLGRAGLPPHYTPPMPERGALGTYWFNAEQPGAGSGWDLEATAFHEAVPGHHLQLSRQLGLTDLPSLQSHGLVTAHAEGWGLYAEVLAGELGLYSSPEARLGALGVQLFRAARLVVDTGLHALGWSRDEAVAWLGDTVPFPLPFVTAEVSRYLGMPGQALAYWVGCTELLALREQARTDLGDRFDLAGFHAAVLDQGTLPLPAVRLAVQAWTDGARARA